MGVMGPGSAAQKPDCPEGSPVFYTAARPENGCLSSERAKGALHAPQGFRKVCRACGGYFLLSSDWVSFFHCFSTGMMIFVTCSLTLLMSRGEMMNSSETGPAIL